jgi:hypothetical protein
MSLRAHTLPVFKAIFSVFSRQTPMMRIVAIR